MLFPSQLQLVRLFTIKVRHLHERPTSRSPIQQRLSTHRAHHAPKQIMRIIFDQAIRMLQECRHALPAQPSKEGLNIILGCQKITTRQTHMFTARTILLTTHDLLLHPHRLVPILCTNRLCACGRCTTCIAWQIAKVGRLIHVDPQPINVHARILVKEARKLRVPEFLHPRREPVREPARPGPYLARPHTAVGRLHQRVHGHAVVVRLVVAPRHGRVDHHDVVLVVGV